VSGFRYDGKRVIVTGAASGMGAATVAMLADVGAEVHALDVKPVPGPVTQAIETDVGDPRSVDAALAKIGAPVHCLFNVAGVPQTLPAITVLRVNYLGLRHLTEGALSMMPAGGSVANVASIAGSQWAAHLETVGDLVDTDDFDAGVAWCDAHLEAQGDPYNFSKECVIVYTMRRSRDTMQQGVRMNALSPGVVESPMMPDFRAALGGEIIEWTAQQANGRLGRPEEMAPPLVFLGSDEASYVNGSNLIADGGFSAALATGRVDFASFPRA